MTFDGTWIIPERGASWLQWGFGTRHSVLQNEVASVKQVHESRVMSVEEAGLAGEADALITSRPGLSLGIKTADCLPVLMADLNQRVVSAVHAGWRGTAKNIVRETVLEMGRKYETKPKDLLVALGPAIGQCCFEVGAEVAQVFTDFNPDFAKVTGKCHLDLHAINEFQLVRAGIRPDNILRVYGCTMCDSERFWSFRREWEDAGRMWSVVEIEE